MSEPLDRTRPLWHFYLVDGHEGGSVVVSRFHHALADGIALAQVLLSLTDEHEDGDLLGTTSRRARSRAPPHGARPAARAERHPRPRCSTSPAGSPDPVTAGLRGR